MKLCVLPGFVLALSLVGCASLGTDPVDMRWKLLLAAEAGDSGHSDGFFNPAQGNVIDHSGGIRELQLFKKRNSSAGDRSHSRLAKLKRGVDWHCQTAA